jgi:hypothetical protein
MKVHFSLPKIPHKQHAYIIGMSALTLLLGSLYYVQHKQYQSFTYKSRAEETNLRSSLDKFKEQLASTQASLHKLETEDQKVRNDKLQEEIDNIHKTYKEAVKEYEELVKLREQTNKTDELDKQISKVLTMLSEKNYTSASAELASLKSAIQKKKDEIASTFNIPANVATNNNPPGAGYARQKVDTPIGSYLVDIISADLGSTRVIVDTASEGDCRDNCPVMALGDFAARSGAYAGINGPYFCPASYPSCAGKTNSFDTLIMNKNKTYFISDNNVYSTVPAVIFFDGSARYVGQSLEWGRDTGPTAVIAAQPMLLSDGNNIFGGDSEPKRGSKGPRSFIGSKDNVVYIGVVQNATVAEVAYVLQTLGLKYALNLDSGGSTALWSNGRYLVGPGRNTPFGILFVRK